MRTLHSYLPGRTELNDEAIKLRAPSVFATAAHAEVSSRYSFIPTIDVVNAMRTDGWMVVEAKEQRVRSESKLGYQKHLLKFRQRGTPNVGEFVPEISLVNSHDGTATFQPGFGLWRLVCSNGLVVCEKDFFGRAVRHVGDAPAEVVKSSRQLFENLPLVTNRVDQFQNRILSQPEQAEFARQAIVLRFGSVQEAPITEASVLGLRRGQDRGDSLWVTFNRIQENFVRGGLRDRSKVDENGKRFPRTRAITSLTVDLDFNRKLWDIAAGFLGGN